jgi:peroxiredoxin
LELLRHALALSLGFALLFAAACKARTEEGAARGSEPESVPVEAPAPDLTLLDVDGTSHTPLDVDGVTANVLVFVTVDCPISNAYSPTFQTLLRDYADDPLQFYLVHVDPEVTAEGAREHAQEYGLEGTLLLDSRQELARAVGATITPEAAVVTAGGHVAYRGRIDNWYGDLGRKRPQASRHDLRDAIEAVLEGEQIVVRTEAIGCYLPALPRE